MTAPRGEPSVGGRRRCRPVELEQLQEAWRRSILPAVEERSIPIGKTLSEAHPSGLDDDTLTLVFPRSAAFHLSLAEDPKNAALLRDALYAVTGRKLAVAFALGDDDREGASADEEACERRGRPRADEEHLRRTGAGDMSFRPVPSWPSRPCRCRRRRSGCRRRRRTRR